MYEVTIDHTENRLSKVDFYNIFNDEVQAMVVAEESHYQTVFHDPEVYSIQSNGCHLHVFLQVDPTLLQFSSWENTREFLAVNLEFFGIEG